MAVNTALECRAVKLKTDGDEKFEREVGWFARMGGKVRLSWSHRNILRILKLDYTVFREGGDCFYCKEMSIWKDILTVNRETVINRDPPDGRCECKQETEVM